MVRIGVRIEKSRNLVREKRPVKLKSGKTIMAYRWVRKPDTIDGMRDKKFQEWFRGSKVVDGEGNPLKVFSGQPKGRESFYSADRNEMPEGVAFFTLSYDTASLYAGTHEYAKEGRSDYSLGKDGEVGEYYLAIKNPWDLDIDRPNLWIHAAARKEMGEDYFSATDAERWDEGWYYFFKKYGWPPEMEYDEELTRDDWIARGYGLLDVITESGRWDGQEFTLEYALSGKLQGMLAVLEPELAEDIIARKQYDGFVYRDNEHDGDVVFVPFTNEQIMRIG